jgi:hypothetical protein
MCVCACVCACVHVLQRVHERKGMHPGSTGNTKDGRRAKEEEEEEEDEGVQHT